MQVTVFVYIFVSCSQITTARQWAGSTVYTMYKPVSTEEMFSAAKCFKYIQSGSRPRVVTQKI